MKIKQAIIRGMFLVTLMYIFITVFITPPFFAQVEKIEKTEQEIAKEKRLRQKLEKEKGKVQIEEKIPPVLAPIEGEEKILVKKITVTGVTLIPEKEINEIILRFENKQTTLRQMQEAADLITDAYRKKGYLTSRAYLPPQKIQEGMLEIRVVEGITGDIDIKGNRYFKSSLYRDKIVLKKGELFNYENLRKGLSIINQLPDRNAKAVLTPSKEPGSTDVVLEVKDRLPIHIGFDWDNYGSPYIDKQRLRITLTDNNLVGMDDVLTLQYQLSQGEKYKLLLLRYLYPLNENLKLGFFAADSKIDLRRNLNARGKSRLYSMYLTQSLINRENVGLNLNLGFDYKDIFNFQNDAEASRDRMRVIKTSLDLDLTDTMGRTIIDNEVSYGIAGIMGGLKKRDPRSSRSGAGGEFCKDTLGLLRLQKMPFNSVLLWKNQFQFTGNILTAAEQFQTGGIINVRAYPPAEVVGDRGYSMTWELSMPPYFLPKDIGVPFSRAKFYDALRLVIFYDWANTYLKRPTATEEKNKTLRGVGCGLRFNLPEDFSLRLEVAWPLDNMPSDGDHAHTLFEVSKSF